jgi:tetratricopeptide (TPR) repeat protein
VEASRREPEVEYWVGEAYRAMGKPDEARTHWRKSAGSQPGAHDYYRACSLRALGQTEQANTIFRDLTTRAGQVGHYNAALGYLGLNDTAKARDELTKALKERPDDAGARFALQRL